MIERVYNKQWCDNYCDIIITYHATHSEIKNNYICIILLYIIIICIYFHSVILWFMVILIVDMDGALVVIV